MDNEQLKAIKDKQNASKDQKDEHESTNNNNKRGKKVADKGAKSATKQQANESAANPETVEAQEKSV